MSQSKLTTRGKSDDVNPDLNVLRRILRDGKGEDERAWTNHLEIFVRVFRVLSIAAINEEK
jgi:hypothetical protein